jgi:hypothetical protein
MTTAPDIGVHRGVPPDVYHSWPLLSSSVLKELARRTPMHARWRADHPPDDTDAMRVGTALHCLLLDGPDTFEASYSVGGPVNEKTGKAYGSDTKAYSEWAAAQSALGKVFLSADECRRVEAMATSIMAHPAARARFRDSGAEREVSIVFRPFVGLDLLMKARIDLYCPSFRSVADVKTTATSAAGYSFSRVVYDRGYDIQAAVYVLAMRSAGFECDWFDWIAVEKSPPNAVAVHRLAEESLGKAIEQTFAAIERWDSCVRSGEWPGYAGSASVIETPKWATAGVGDEEESW